VYRFALFRGFHPDSEYHDKARQETFCPILGQPRGILLLDRGDTSKERCSLPTGPRIAFLTSVGVALARSSRLKTYLYGYGFDEKFPRSLILAGVRASLL
jgi:hypothetical protein